MKKKITLYAVVFFTCVGIGFLISYLTRPVKKNINPLVKIEVDKITKVTIHKPSEVISFQKNNSTWTLTSPLSDLADPANVKRLINKLSESEISPAAVSENKNKYDQFNISSGVATQIQVFASESKPIFDVFVGKGAAVYGSSYIRFEGKDSVYVASDLPSYLVSEPATDYRMRKLWLLDIPLVSRIQIQSNKLSFSLVQSSSETWVDEAHGNAPVDSVWVKNLIQNLQTTEAFNFGTGQESSSVLGFEKPTLIVSLQDKGGTSKVVFGNFQDKEKQNRFAQTEGRSSILIVQEAVFSRLQSYIQTFPQLSVKK